MGQTRSNENTTAFHVYETPEGKADYSDGGLNARGNVLGTYMHGLFHNSGLRHNLLNHIRRQSGIPERQYGAVVDKDTEYDKLAELVRNSLNMELVYEIINKGVERK
jgi:adenosylcobyric acid synthase